MDARPLGGARRARNRRCLTGRDAGRTPGGVIGALLLSLGQLADPRVLRVLARSLALTLLIFAALGAGTWWLLDRWLAVRDGGGLLAGAAALAVLVLGGWLLFRAVAVAVVGLFADEVVEAVEARHYPAALASARPVPFARSAAAGLRSAGRALGVNLLLTPLYLLLLATGVGAPALFFAANAWLLGRDLGEMVASRHLDAAAARDWRARTRAGWFVLGLAGTGLFVVPGLNLLAPVLGAAAATHFFHRSRT